MKHCIITSELAGPTKNGGIGTHCYYLASFLSQRLKQDVTVLLTNHPPDLDHSHWKKHFSEKCGFQFETLQNAAPFTDIHYDRHYYHLVSLNTCRWLKDRDFDFCHFQDWNGNGFIAMQTRRCGIAFRNTIFTCTLHSPDEWLREANRVLMHNGADDLLQDYMEQYSAKMADYVISPVKYMLDWTKENGWELPRKTRILPYLIEDLEQPSEKKFNPHHIIYFGRLETRKGLDIFVGSLKLLRDNPVFNEKKIEITFLGRVQQVRGVDGLEYLQTAAKNFSSGENWEYLTDLDHFQALEYLRKNSGALVVIPSPVDNSPYTVIECLQMNLNLIAANTGGIPELVGSSKRLFSPDVKSLADKILEAQTGGVSPLTSKSYNREKSEQKWEKFIGEITELKTIKSNKKITKKRKTIPKISVTVSHYNLGRYLPEALDTLQKQTYENYEVIVVDDGSNEKESIGVFNEQREKYESNSARWKFFKKENKGLGHTRNFGAQKADGQYLVFFDADNLAEEFMLESMIESMHYSRADCLSCFYPAFVEDYKSDEDYNCCFMPFGACKEFGTFENLFGDANFIIRPEVFAKLGGFTEDPLTATHDWQFLAKLIMDGYELDVIPRFLFKYRIRKDSMINTLDNKHSILSSIDPYTHEFGLREKKLTVMATALDREYREKKHLLALTEEKIRWIQNSISSHQGQLDSFSRQTQNLSKQVKSLHEEKKSLHSRLDEFWKQNRSLNTHLNDAKVNINNLHSDINKLNANVNSLNLRLDYTKAELFEARDLANRLSADEFYQVGKFFRNIYKKIKRSFN